MTNSAIFTTFAEEVFELVRARGGRVLDEMDPEWQRFTSAVTATESYVKTLIAGEARRPGAEVELAEAWSDVCRWGAPQDTDFLIFCGEVSLFWTCPERHNPERHLCLSLLILLARRSSRHHALAA